MGIDTRRPPLPQPTEESWADNISAIAPSDLATDVSRRTDRTSYSIPEDGSPITINTKKYKLDKTGSGVNSQASLLIEYYEDKPHSRPSVRVKVSPSSSKRSSRSSDIKITQVGSDNRPSYTRRISLGRKNEPQAVGGTEVSHSSGNNSHPPIEIEVLKNSSDISSPANAQIRVYPMASDISSMPADSMLEGPVAFRSPMRKTYVREVREELGNDTLKPPPRPRSRSLSRERIAHKVIEKLTSDRRTEESDEKRMAKNTSSRSRGKDFQDEDLKAANRRSSKQYLESDLRSGTESSLRPRDNDSNLSGASRSSVTNPKVIKAVEDAIRRLILPEIESIKRQQSQRYERGGRDSYVSGSSRSKSEISKSSTSTSTRLRATHDESESGILASGDAQKERRRRRSSREGTEKSQRRSASREEHHRERERRRKDIDRGSRDEYGGLASPALSLLEREEERKSQDRRRRRSSRTESGLKSSNSKDDRRQAIVPPLPLTGEPVDSELTRDSILSAETNESERLLSDYGVQTPLRSVSRFLPQAVPLPQSPTLIPLPPSRNSNAKTPTSIPLPPSRNSNVNTPTSIPLPPSRNSDKLALKSNRAVTPTRNTQSPGVHSIKSNKSSDKSIRTKATRAALAAAGLGGAATSAVYTPKKQRDGRVRTPLLQHSVERLPDEASSAPSTPGINYPTTHKRHQAIYLDHAIDDADSPSRCDVYGETREDDADGFFDEQQRVNDKYRYSYDYDNQRESALSYDNLRSANSLQSEEQGDDRSIKGVGAAPGRVVTPIQVESAVASLVEASNVDNEQSQLPGTQRFSFQSTVHGDDARDLGSDSPASAQDAGFHTSHDNSSRDRWMLIKENAKALSNERLAQTSPQRNDKTQDPSGQQIAAGRQGHSTTSSLTNLSDEKFGDIPEDGGLLGYGKANIEGWVVENHNHSNFAHVAERNINESSSQHNKPVGIEGPVSVARGNLPSHEVDGFRGERSTAQFERRSFEQPDARLNEPFIEETDRYIGEEDDTPTPTNMKDEGYGSGHLPRSPEDTPLSYAKAPRRLFEEVDLTQQRSQSLSDDPYVVKNKYSRSQKIESPMYNNSVGAGAVGSIQSQDIVALMDHLTVRDGQRNARDTEILITLVRSAAETRSAFEDVKRFIENQNRINMERIDLDTDRAVDKIITSHKAQPSLPRRTELRPAAKETEDASAKKNNIFKRALGGLRSKNQTDISRLEDMLMELLDQVDALREAQSAGPQYSNHREPSVTFYDRPGAAPASKSIDNPALSSAPQAVNYGASPQQARQQPNMHTGLVEHTGIIQGQYRSGVGQDNYAEEQDDGMRTPTQDNYRTSQFTNPERRLEQPADEELTAAEKARKHKSNGSSSLWGIPRMSRWSKTTASSAPENRSPEPTGRIARETAFSDASRSGSDINVLPGASGSYTIAPEDQLRSLHTVSPERQSAEYDLPLPSQRPRSSDSPFRDDPKYRAQRNSITLEHPQPRSGSTRRHQNRLEFEANNFDDDLPVPSPDSDAFGSAPSLARLHGGVLGAVQRPHTLNYLSNAESQSKPAASSETRTTTTYERSPDLRKILPEQPIAPQPAPPSLYNTPFTLQAPSSALKPPSQLSQPTARNESQVPGAAGSAFTKWTVHNSDNLTNDDDSSIDQPAEPISPEDDEEEEEWLDDSMIPLSRKRSPYIPGALLAPIEERYSMEGDRSSLGYRDSVKSNRSNNLAVGRGPHGHAHRFSVHSMPGDGEAMADVREEDEGEEDVEFQQGLKQDREREIERERSVTPTAVARPAVGAREEPVRKLTGPREMPGQKEKVDYSAGLGRTDSGAVGGTGTALMGTVRRKPARRSG